MGGSLRGSKYKGGKALINFQTFVFSNDPVAPGLLGTLICVRSKGIVLNPRLEFLYCILWCLSALADWIGNLDRLGNASVT